MALGFLDSIFDANRDGKLSLAEEVFKYVFLYDCLFGDIDEQTQNEPDQDINNTQSLL
jgi:hypothetical protein